MSGLRDRAATTNTPDRMRLVHHNHFRGFLMSDASAVAAVRALHTDSCPGGKGGLRARCRECGFAYPCPTIEAIEGAMNAKL